MSKSKVFTKVLPVAWQIAATLKVLTEGFITFMALQVSHPGANYIFLGAILSAILNIIIYMYSDAKEMLTAIGKNIDDRLNGYLGYKIDPSLHSRRNNSTPSKKIMSATALACISANTVIAGISVHQEYILLIDKYIDLNPELSDAERELHRHLITWLVVNLYIMAGAYNNLAFQGSFSAKLIEDLSKKYEGRQDFHVETIDNLDEVERGLFFRLNKVSNRFSEIEQTNLTRPLLFYEAHRSSSKNRAASF